MTDTTTLTGHDQIRDWVESRGATPTKVAETGGTMGDGILRLSFGEMDDGLEPVSWDEFFAIFDDKQLALLAATEEGNDFNKFVSR